MSRFSALLFLSFPCALVLALPNAQARSKKTPVSVSYETAVKCFGKLWDERLQSGVDLKILKEKIDAISPTSTTQLLTRTIQYREGSGTLRRVSLEHKSGAGMKQEFTAYWETISDSGTVDSWIEHPLKKATVLMSEVNPIVGPGVIERDETLYLDTKLNGLKVRTRKGLNKLLEVSLEESGKKTLRCEETEKIGAICTCLKK